MRVRSYFSIFLAACLLGSYLSVYVLLEQYSYEKAAHQQVNDIKLAIKDVERLGGHIQQVLVMVDLILASGETYLIAGANENSDLIVADLKAISADPAYQDSKQDFNILQTHLADIQQTIQRAAGLNLKSDEPVLSKLLQHTDIAAETIIEVMEKIDRRLHKTEQANQAYAEQQSQRSWLIAVAVVCLLGLLIISIWLWTARNISRPVQLLSSGAEKAMDHAGVFEGIRRGPFELLQLSKKLYRLISGLEDEVTIRTQELTESKKYLEATNLRLQEEIRQNHLIKARFESAFNNAAIGMAIVDLDGCIIKFNEKFQKFFGFADSKLINQQYANLLYKNGRDIFEDNFARLVTKQLAQMELQQQYNNASDKVVWGLLSATLETGPDGAPSYSIFQLQDITKSYELSAWQRAVLDSADYCIISTDAKGVIVTFNKKAQKMLGYSAKEVIGTATPAIIHDPGEVKQYAGQLSQEFNEQIEPGFEVFVRKAREGIIDEREWTYVHKDGSCVPVYLSVTALRSANEEIIGFLGIATDLTEHKDMMANLEETETLYHGLFNNAGDAINLLDANGIVVDCNPAALELFGCSRDEYIGRPAAYFSPEFQPDGESTSKKAEKIIQSAFVQGQQFFEWLHRKEDGTEFIAEVSLSKVEIENKPYLQGIIRDITERKRLEQKLAYQAGHDSLTGLPNRKTLHDVFPVHLKDAEKHRAYVVMMLLDLDRFKDINDTLGHHIGDQVLAQVGPRLRNKCTEKNTTIARLGGDEFALLMTTNSSTDQLKLLADSIVESLRLPFEAGGVKVSVGASIGVAIYPEHGNNSHELLRAADVAMYTAKKRSLGVVIYNASIDEYSTQRLKIANELLNAIKQKQLVLHYQPKINIATGKVSGFEALVRWNHPTEGLLFPDRFIDLVEMSEIIHPFTKLVIEMAVSDKQSLRAMGYDQPVAINLSARNLIDERCYEALESALASSNLSTSEVELELTESAFMHEPENAVALLNKFHGQGIKTAIDDFGTGFSSLSYLRQLPVYALKIDRSFVMNMRKNTQDSAIVRSTIALAHSLDVKVIAEGVEDDETLDLLNKMECDFAQGYGICRPVPKDQLINWFKQVEN